MPRRRSALSLLRRSLYLSQRRIGDVQAMERSPNAYLKRRARRAVTRSAFRLFR